MLNKACLLLAAYECTKENGGQGPHAQGPTEYFDAIVTPSDQHIIGYPLLKRTVQKGACQPCLRYAWDVESTICAGRLGVKVRGRDQQAVPVSILVQMR